MEQEFSKKLIKMLDKKHLECGVLRNFLHVQKLDPSMVACNDAIIDLTEKLGALYEIKELLAQQKALEGGSVWPSEIVE